MYIIWWFACIGLYSFWHTHATFTILQINVKLYIVGEYIAWKYIMFNQEFVLGLT